jgi:hypothetical protein
MRPPYRLISKAVPAMVVVAATLAFAPGASAAPAPPMIVEVHPASGEVKSYFDLTASPGRRAVAGTLELRNRLRRKVTVLLDPVNGLTASTLGSAYSVRGGAIGGPTRWTRLSDRRIELAPRGKAEVEVTVSPSQGAKPGDYLSGCGGDLESVHARLEAGVCGHTRCRPAALRHGRPRARDRVVLTGSERAQPPDSHARRASPDQQRDDGQVGRLADPRAFGLERDGRR